MIIRNIQREIRDSINKLRVELEPYYDFSMKEHCLLLYCFFVLDLLDGTRLDKSDELENSKDFSDKIKVN